MRCVSSELRDSIVDCEHTSLSELQLIWDEIGIRGEMLRAEYSSVLNHVRTMWSDKIAEETARREKIVENITSYQASINKMSSQLGQRLTVEVCDCK